MSEDDMEEMSNQFSEMFNNMGGIDGMNMQNDFTNEDIDDEKENKNNLFNLSNMFNLSSFMVVFIYTL